MLQAINYFLDFEFIFYFHLGNMSSFQQRTICSKSMSLFISHFGIFFQPQIQTMLTTKQSVFPELMHYYSSHKEVYEPVIYCHVTNYPKIQGLKTTNIYYLMVSLGQESRCDWAGSSGFGSFPKTQSPPGLTLKDPLSSSLTNCCWQDSLPAAFPWEFSVPCHVHLSKQHLSTWQPCSLE